MIPDIDYHAAADWLAERRAPLLLSHRGPDGDSIGSLAALARLLQQRGTTPRVALFGALPARYRLASTWTAWLDWEQSRESLVGDADAVVILDTCALSQLEPAVDSLRNAPPILVIDHHLTTDPIGQRAGDLRLIDGTAGATCLLVAEWARTVGLAVDADTAAALFVGIATDCGWFRFSNTDARLLRAAAELIESGAEPARLYDALHNQDPPQKLQLIARMLQSLELHAGGELAAMYLREADFAASGADAGMRDDLVNEATRLAGTDVTVLFTEEPDGGVRVNFRSKRGLDVAQLAARYGGGGHARAAGARPHGSWDNVVPRILAEAVEALGG